MGPDGEDPRELRDAAFEQGEAEAAAREALSVPITRERTLTDAGFLARYLVACPRACGAVEAMATAGYTTAEISAAFREAFELDELEQEAA